MAQMHEKTTHMIMDVLKLSMPSKKSRKNSMLVGLQSPGKPGSPMSPGKKWGRDTLISEKGSPGRHGNQGAGNLGIRFDAIADDEQADDDAGATEVRKLIEER